MRHLAARASAAGNAALAGRLRCRAAPTPATLIARAVGPDRQLVATALAVALRHLHPLPNPTESRTVAVLAVGGYGRAEMAPHSDVDLLFLTPWKITPWAESVIESMLYMLWDLKLKVGHASRTVKDCLRLGREDITIRTALLEHRFIAGHEPLADELGDRLWAELFRNTGPEFIEAKLAERAERHRGRAASAMCWSPTSRKARAACATCRRSTGSASTCTACHRPRGWWPRACSRREEYDTFARAEDFLWAVRCHLHYITGRATDQLTFDLQVEVADRMGYARRGRAARGRTSSCRTTSATPPAWAS